MQNVQALGIPADVFHLANVSSNGSGRVAPERVEVCPNNQRFERRASNFATNYILASDVSTLALRTLKGADQVVSWPRLPVPNLVLDLRKAGSIEVSWNRGLKPIEIMGGEAVGTPGTLTWRESASAVPKVGANNP